MADTTATDAPSLDNLYKLDGRVPVAQAVPFGFQHVLAMFTANITPIFIIAGLAMYQGQKLTTSDTALLIQSCMIVAGLGTLIQLYPIWKIGARLPVVMGISFTFVPVAINIASKDYGCLLGACIVGGALEGVLGLLARYWRRLLSPVICASIVLSIGLSLLKIGAQFFSGGEISAEGNNIPYLTVALITLVASLIFAVRIKGHWRQLYILFGIAVGYLAACLITISGWAPMVNFDLMLKTSSEIGFVSLPRMFHYVPKFELGAIISIALIHLVSAAETIGDTSAICEKGLGRNVTEKEISGSLACDGFASCLSASIFGCLSVTSFSQNVGLVSLTKVVNRFTLMLGALILIAAGLFPPIGAFMATLPLPVLGGGAVVMFGVIVLTGADMISKCCHTQRNSLIAATSICLGVGSTFYPHFYSSMPELIQSIFAQNEVACVFVIALIMDLFLPKDVEESTELV